jgi:hypothetical protein
VLHLNDSENLEGREHSTVQETAKPGKPHFIVSKYIVTKLQK